MKIILIVLSFLFISCAQREELILSEETSPINIIKDDIKIISPKFGEV
ncbi:hypothetical protein [Stygiobacter electus]|uniref:Uncharacterized protein n=1 Tax=Stygiobacter electus TaxID=3032292 RepID=A0AAE3P220_9BACT|nr:hypothetical protein [Stygiobacter electus]MDF1612944.1 hypothetical protein [Stygiobacter electus]